MSGKEPKHWGTPKEAVIRAIVEEGRQLTYLQIQKRAGLSGEAARNAIDELLDSGDLILRSRGTLYKVDTPLYMEYKSFLKSTISEDETTGPIVDHELMMRLASRKPKPHHEADFQLALAWEIYQHNPECEITLEYRPKGSRHRLDLWVDTGAFYVAVELKLKKARSSRQHIRQQFIEDIKRLESITIGQGEVEGHAILLTNDPTLWTDPILQGTHYSNTKWRNYSHLGQARHARHRYLHVVIPKRTRT